MISYIGGKARIGKWIAPHIPTHIETYVEPFGGMFWVFFNMDLKNYPNLKTVVYNDYNKLNSNLFKCSLEYDRLWEELSKYPCQQLGVEDTPPEYAEIFKQCQKEVFDPNFEVGDEPNFEAAGKYVYVLTQVFSGSKPETSTYTDYKGKYRCKVLIFMDKLKHPEYRKHLDKITFVENMDFADVIKKYDSPSTYFYLDPPYWKTENYYSNHDFDSNDHQRLAETLHTIKGNFSLSYYDFPKLSEWFPTDSYVWTKADFAKAAAATKERTQNIGTELLIMNYIPPSVPVRQKKEKKEDIIVEDTLMSIPPIPLTTHLGISQEELEEKVIIGENVIFKDIISQQENIENIINERTEMVYNLLLGENAIIYVTDEDKKTIIKSALSSVAYRK